MWFVIRERVPSTTLYTLASPRVELGEKDASAAVVQTLRQAPCSGHRSPSTVPSSFVASGVGLNGASVSMADSTARAASLTRPVQTWRRSAGARLFLSSSPPLTPKSTDVLPSASSAARKSAMAAKRASRAAAVSVAAAAGAAANGTGDRKARAAAGAKRGPRATRLAAAVERSRVRAIVQASCNSTRTATARTGHQHRYTTGADKQQKNLPRTQAKTRHGGGRTSRD
mmetsp:Transcript_9346/g.27352  ORF Transcript_9346/g.27352 Transcript_9346/m.27352 type:complete len:228 (+) Transcript_9346:425-1108(+)